MHVLAALGIAICQFRLKIPYSVFSILSLTHKLIASYNDTKLKLRYCSFGVTYFVGQWICLQVAKQKTRNTGFSNGICKWQYCH